ncbi:MAG: hypothetical protein LBC31_10790 [Treponema sp.]|jgi:hypothetical protein|nr:hypothetical protein [Treponema sp.]
MGIKNNFNIATLVSSLMGDIFDISQSVYDTLQTTWRGWDSAKYDFGDGRFISSGLPGRDFRDKLNYAAMVTDYGLAEIFAGILAATATVQSAGINLSSRGDVSLSGLSITNTFSNRENYSATPSLAIQEAVNIFEMSAAAAEFGKLGINIAYGIKARVNAAAEEPELEALYG